MTHAERSADTRARLLEAAVEVFAEEGFRGATIQRICKLAGANIAAAHYHFGDKEGLYAAVFEYAERHAAERTPAETAEGKRPPRSGCGRTSRPSCRACSTRAGRRGSRASWPGS